MLSRFENTRSLVAAFCIIQSVLCSLTVLAVPAMWPALWRAIACLAAELLARESAGRVADRARAHQLFSWAWSASLGTTWVSFGAMQERYVLVSHLDGLSWSLGCDFL